MTTLEIALLGRFAVTVEGRPAGAFEHRRGADLVKVLALAPGHRLARDRVVELLWPALPADAGVANLHKAAHYARRALGDRRAVVLRNGFVELAPDAAVTTDVERFEAGDAYGGPLLPDDEYEPWAVPERERLLQLHVERLRRDGRWEELLEADPVAEDAHRALLREALESGDRVAAARRLRRLRDELSELGLQPEEETLLLAGELAEGPAVEAPLGPRAPIVGRDEELGLAARVLQQATAGSGTTLLVCGDAGIGKTRFVDAVLALAQRRGWHTLRGAAHGDHADVPYRPLVEALEVLLAERADLLAGLATGAREALGRLVPAAASDGSMQPVGRSQRHAALAAMAHLVRAAARERGLVLALEDLHAADEATLQAIDYLATAVRREPVVIVAAARPTAPDHAFARLAATLRRHGTGTDVTLEALGDQDIRTLAERAVAGPLPTPTLDAVVRTAAGNPFYAQELAAVADATGGLRVPRHVEEALDARLDRLPTDAVALLPALAVAGTSATPDALAADAELPVPRAAAALAEAAADGVLRRHPDGGWDFRHPLLREAAARRTAPATLAQAHARAAARLAATGGAPQQVAHHLLQAGDGTAAVPFLTVAARSAAAVGAYADGRRWLEQALPHAGPEDRAELHALLADLRYATGDRAATAAYATALRSAAGDDVAELKVKQALAAIVAGDLDAAEHALAGVAEGTPRAAATAGMVTWFRGDVEGASRHAEAAQALLDETGGELPILDTLRALVAHTRGRWEAHTELELSPGRHVPELAGQVFDAYLCVTECVLHLGDPEDRLAAFAEDLHRQAVTAGAKRGEAFAATVIGEAHLLAGRPDLARAHLHEAVTVSRRVGAVSGEALARARLGEALHALGDEVGARASLAEALELAHASALAHHLLFLVHVPMLRLERDPAAALALVDSSQILLEDQGVCVFCPVAYAIAAASACVRGGDLERAEALLGRARASASMWPPGSWSPAICEVAGELARARGDEQAAATLLRRAVDGYAASGQRLYEERAAAALAG